MTLISLKIIITIFSLKVFNFILYRIPTYNQLYCVALFLDEDELGTPLSSAKKTMPAFAAAQATTVVSEGLRAGWPSILTLLTRDQYGRLVHVPNLKVSKNI